VHVFGVRGDPPSDRLKVALNYPGGWRNTMTLVLTGLDQDRKADRAITLLGEVLGGWEQFGQTDIRRIGPTLQITVKSPDREKVGRRFSNATMELLLASYAGAYATTPPGDATEYGVYWPTLIPKSAVEHTVRLPDGSRHLIAGASVSAAPSPRAAPSAASKLLAAKAQCPTESTAAPLGAVCGGRSGDKGGNANVGLWTRADDAYRWLADYLTIDRFRGLLPEAKELQIRRFELPNLRALNFVVVGLLGEGVASSVRPDPQAKGLAEQLRAEIVNVPRALLNG
jgi:hypothetical protein